MKDTEISKVTEIPLQTLAKWKKDNESWRFLIYNFFAKKDTIELVEDFERLKRLRELKKENH